MEEATSSSAACEIARLPEDLLSASISRTSPRDACRAALVSPAFRAAADSDAVWACFAPPGGLPPLAAGELLGLPPPATKKALYLRLSDRPVLLADGLVSMRLDRETGARCYMLSARALQIVWGDTEEYWNWIPLANTDSRFQEAAMLRAVCWLEIRGKIHSKMLSQNRTYVAYMVFKIDDESYGLDYPLQEASVSIGEKNSTRPVCINGYDDEDEEGVPPNYLPFRMPSIRRRVRRRNRRVPPFGANVALPQKRADGWMELEMGEFNNEEGDDGEVSISLTETRGGNWKKGLIVQGIEIRAKK